jgi:hypothetical protein
MIKLITINPLLVLKSTLKQLRIAVKLYSIIQDWAKLFNTIKVVKGEEDNLTKPVNNIIKTKDKDIVKLTKEVCLCLFSLTKKIFVPNKDNKSEVKFV